MTAVRSHVYSRVADQIIAELEARVPPGYLHALQPKPVHPAA